MKKFIKYPGFLFGIFMIIIVAGCKKDFDPAPGTQPKKMNDLDVSQNFDWKMTKDVEVNIGVSLPDLPASSFVRITIYDRDPFSDGHPLFSGSAGLGINLVAKLSLPLALKEIYMEASYSGAVQQIVVLEAADKIEYTFQPIDGGLKSSSSLLSGPDCSSGCDFTLSGTGSQTISNGSTYCITSSYTGNIIITRGTLKVCGTYSGAVTMGSSTYNCNLIVTAGGTASIGSLSMGRKSTLTIYENSTATLASITMTYDAKAYNYGTFTITGGGLSSNNLVENFNQMTVTGNYSMTTNAIFHNSGTLHVTGTFNTEKEITNSGVIEVDGNLNLCTTLSNVTNTCKIIVHGNFKATNCNFTMDAGYLKTDNLTEFSSTSYLLMKNASMISTKDYKQYQDVNGQGGCNEIKISNSGIISSGKKVKGNIEMSTPTGTLTTGGPSNFINGATLVSFANSIVYIPVTACNPEGNASPPCADSDGDGVTDCDDDYPSDPTRAYNNYTSGTAVWEDLWPSKGDYDLNDLVNYYHYNVITNAQNQVVDIIAKFYARAVGASLHNGFGFQFDQVLPAQISSVSGYELTQGYILLNANGTESGQNKAVVIVWDDAENVIHRAGGSFFNTLPGSPAGTADTVTLTIHLTSPLSTAIVGTPPFNPFLIKDMNRSIEIHLPGYVPTALADPGYFGTLDDDSNPLTDRYYKTVTNLPWALNIPTNFDYPFEYIDINLAYNYFSAWAESDGLLNLDWYFDLPGYRNTANIYH